MSSSGALTNEYGRPTGLSLISRPRRPNCPALNALTSARTRTEYSASVQWILSTTVPSVQRGIMYSNVVRPGWRGHAGADAAAGYIGPNTVDCKRSGPAQNNFPFWTPNAS